MAVVINPRFSNSEIATIDELMRSGKARSRADFVRSATLRAIWELENNEKKEE